MARMPQIPQTDLGPLPGGGVKEGGMPSSLDGGAKILGAAARTAEGIGRDVESLEHARQIALDKKQAIVDGIAATKLLGDYQEQSRNLVEQIQRENFDTPDKVPGLVREKLSALNDSTMASAGNSQQALDFAKSAARNDNETLASAHDFVQRRLTQKAKSDVYQMTQSAIRNAAAQQTPEAFAASLARTEKSLRAHIMSVSENPEKEIDDFRSKAAELWVEKHSPEDPARVGAILDGDNAVVKHLPTEKLAPAQKRAQTDLKVFGENHLWNEMKAAVGRGATWYDLFRSGELKPDAVQEIQNSFDDQKRAVDAHPNLTPEMRAKINDVIQQNSDTLRYLSEAARKPGKFDPILDQTKQARLMEDLTNIMKPAKAQDPVGLLDTIKLRKETALALANHLISPSRAETINKSIALATKDALAKEASDTGHRWKIPDSVPFCGGWGGRSAHQSGTVVLNDAFDEETGKYRNFTETQKTSARFDYAEAMYKAQEKTGQIPDVATAESFARQALEYAAKSGAK